MKSKTFGILNGPNLGRLGKREPEIYGSATLEDLEALLVKDAAELDCKVECFQSNHEGELIDKIEAWTQASVNGLILNGAAFTHTSVALRDAIASSDLPVVEVHISNIYKRESFRHTSLTAPLTVGVITGLGLFGYQAALQYLAANT